MAKSTIDLPDGTKVTVEGSPDEIAKVIQLYAGGQAKSKKGKPKGKTAKKKHSKEGPQTRIGSLIDDGFFAEKQDINGVLAELERRGFIYKQEHISNPLRRLVTAKRLRRMKEDGKWIYMNP